MANLCVSVIQYEQVSISGYIEFPLSKERYLNMFRRQLLLKNRRAIRILEGVDDARGKIYLLINSRLQCPRAVNWRILTVVLSRLLHRCSFRAFLHF